MPGNVTELVYDDYQLYTAEPRTNPVGSGLFEGDEVRVARDCAAEDTAVWCRSALRGSRDPRQRNYVTGARLVREVPTGSLE